MNYPQIPLSIRYCSSISRTDCSRCTPSCGANGRREKPASVPAGESVPAAGRAPRRGSNENQRAVGRKARRDVERLADDAARWRAARSRRAGRQDVRVQVRGIVAQEERRGDLAVVPGRRACPRRYRDLVHLGRDESAASFIGLESSC